MMKIQQRFLFTLFLILAGLLALVSQANAGNPPDPIITITDVERRDNNIMVLRGTLDESSQLPELAFSFLKPGSGTGIDVPVISVDWQSPSGTGHRWGASLDLYNVPDGFYHILVSATFSNGTTITYILEGDPGECTSGICTPGG